MENNDFESFRITVVSLPDRENLVSEVFYKGVQWVEISQEKDELRIQFYSPPDRDYWEFPCDKAIQALEEARKRLLDVG